jgi:hypothetical protein
LHFKNVIEAMTGVSGNKLQPYHLSEEQWQLADDVQEVLKAFTSFIYELISSNIFSSFLKT